MFDYHMHSLVSFDGHAAPEAMVKAAEQAGFPEYSTFLRAFQNTFHTSPKNFR